MENISSIRIVVNGSLKISFAAGNVKVLHLNIIRSSLINKKAKELSKPWSVLMDLLTLGDSIIN